MQSIGIVGVGVMGSAHARYLSAAVSGARVVAVSDVDRARADGIAAEVGAEVVEDPLTLITGSGVDGVIIASPDETHPRLALACLDAGVPALVEKPLASNAEDARPVYDADVDRGLLAVGFMRRFDPQHLALRAAIDEGAVGAPILFRSIHRNPERAPHHSTTLVVTGSAIHDIDTARWLLGEIESVSATGRPTGAPGGFDLVLIEGHHTGGGLSSIEVFVAAGYGYEVSAEIVASEGTVSTLGGDLATTRHGGQRTVSYPQIWLDRFRAAYVAELEAWVRALSGEPFGGAGVEDAYRAQVVAEAALTALETGERVPVPTA